MIFILDIANTKQRREGVKKTPNPKGNGDDLTMLFMKNSIDTRKT